MKVVLIDGHGGRLGQLLAEAIIKEQIPCELYAIGTNGIATSAMMRGGAHYGATGENPVRVACADADVIIGPIGMLAADAMLGEVTPQMAVSLGQSKAIKLLLPVSRCNHQVVGVPALTINEIVRLAVNRLKEICCPL